MAKGIGLIGNFKGKVGNTVGYKLTASNNGQTQGIRVYQPIVKNPKSAGQAEQRAKLLAVNATYRALKMVIDRGNEGLPYGNKSRLAWLKGALKAQYMPWFEKGSVVTAPVICQLSKGSLSSLQYTDNMEGIKVFCEGVTAETTLDTIGKVSTAMLAAYPHLKEGDQVTFVSASVNEGAIKTDVMSFIIQSDSKVATSKFTADASAFIYGATVTEGAIAVIISREGTNGEHLRSTEYLKITANVHTAAPYDEASKTAAIESYQSSDASNSDWAEESIQ